MARLEHSPQITGSYSYRGEDYRIEDGIIEIDDVELARELAASERRIQLLADGDSLPDAEPENEICGAEMTDGSTCERLADECPYH